MAMRKSELDSDIQFLPGVGPKRAALMKSELEVATIGDLIRLYPFRYIDRSTITRICDITEDAADMEILSSGTSGPAKTASAYIQIQAKVVI